MITQLTIVTIFVKNQDEALSFYTEKLGFEKRSDFPLMPGVRWLTVAPEGQKEVEIFLGLTTPELEERIGKNPTWSYSTDNCQATYDEFISKEVKFNQPPTQRPYGLEAVFEDLYGNTFSLLEYQAPAGM
jgi:predicted enzyme related to lactoylglutathione lyase